MSFKRGFFFSIIAMICTTLAFVAGFYVHAVQNPGLEDFPILNQAYEILLDHGLSELPANPGLEYGMIRGMLQAYDDPYTIFVEPVQHELETNSLEGKFGGIGVQLNRDKDGNVILFPFPDSPAVQAGIGEGDQLLEVEDLMISADISIESIQAEIRGSEGTRVRLLIAHLPDSTPVEVSIVRESIPLPSVTWHLDPDNSQLGVIQVNAIAASTPDEIQEAVNDLQSRGGTHFILDLRDNGGGLLSTGVDTARLFLREGVIIQQQYRNGGVETLRVDNPGPFAEVPLAILVNQSTASAAEIIAGALQSHQRAVLVGSPTFGKDTVQLVFDLEDGSSLHVTAGRWWMPELPGSELQSGLQPDVILPEDEDNPNAAMAAASKILFDGQ
jgi:carboxyl-terminal processing protease